MSWIDWLVVGGYLAVVFGVGAWANRRQSDSEDYFLGGRRLKWWAVGISLVATSFSSVSLIGGTAFGFGKGLGWLQLQLGDLLALAVVAFVFLPFFSRLRLTTAYEYLEHRFGPWARGLGSGLFLLQTGARAGILVFGPAALLAPVFGLDVETTILATAAAAILYSTFGGISAVVWTDLLQMLLVLGSVGLCLALVLADVPGGLGAVLDHAAARDALGVVTLEFESDQLFHLTGAVIPYAVLAASLFGTGQQSVQRFLSCEDLAASRRAAFLGWGAGTLALGSTLFLGVAIAAWAELAPGTSGFVPDGSNSVLGEFVRVRLPVGAVGLLLAAVLAASMSSLDSAIHSMSTALMVDWVRRHRRSPLTAAAELRLARVFTFTIGLVAAGAAFLAAGQETNLLETLVNWLGYVAGPMLGLFVLGMATRAGESAAVVATVLAFGATLAAGLAQLPQAYGWHPLWLCPAAFVATVVLGLLPLPDRSRPAGRPPVPTTRRP